MVSSVRVAILVGNVSRDCMLSNVGHVMVVSNASSVSIVNASHIRIAMLGDSYSCGDYDDYCEYMLHDLQCL